MEYKKGMMIVKSHKNEFTSGVIAALYLGWFIIIIALGKFILQPPTLTPLNIKYAMIGLIAVIWLFIETINRATSLKVLVPINSEKEFKEETSGSKESPSQQRKRIIEELESLKLRLDKRRFR